MGGSYKTSFTNFSTGNSRSFGGTFVDLVPHERIRYADRYDGPNLPGEMRTTVTLKKVSRGTELNVVQEGVPDVIPPEMCCLGWQESLTHLALLVEPEIPDWRCREKAENDRRPGRCYPPRPSAFCALPAARGGCSTGASGSVMVWRGALARHGYYRRSVKRP